MTRSVLDQPLIEEDWESLTFRINREVLRSHEIFERERRTMWDRMWLYIGHDTELPEHGDYKTRTVAGRPVIFCRDDDGQVRVFLNSCPHKGTLLCRWQEGNSAAFRCFYHAWTFSNTGQLLKIPEPEAYPDDPAFREQFNLRPVPRLEAYRGFHFISFNPEVGALADHLGEAREYIDLMADQAEDGLEVVPGTHLYGVRGNWKLAVENAMDGYHFSPTHRTFTAYLKETGFQTTDEGSNVYNLDNGHCVLLITGHGGRAGLKWEPRFGEETKPRIEENRRRLFERMDEERAQVIADTSRILYVFPNLLLFDIEGVSVRLLEPTGPDYTEVSAWEFAPRGESEEERAFRLEVLLSFIGPGGLATPDDIEAYECVQRGVDATRGDGRPMVDWSDISRGMEREARGEPGRGTDETALRHFWRHWHRALMED